MQALLGAPDPTSASGARDRVLMMVMYNTGARVSELAGLTIGDVDLDTTGAVHIRGKGRKERAVPLWRESIALLRRWLRNYPRPPTAPLLPNARGRPMTRSGIEHRLRVLVARAAKDDPALANLRVSPQTIRHTTAMHLLQSGVDLSVIAMWLGHESIQTTHQYLDANIDIKRRALDHLHAPRVRRTKARDQQELRRFLERL